MQDYGGIRVSVGNYCPFGDGGYLGGGERFTCTGFVGLPCAAPPPPPPPTISAGDPNGKNNYCSHQADLAAAEELLPGITRGQYESTPQKVTRITGVHVALDALATRTLWQRWIRWKTGVPMTKTAKFAERAAVAFLVYDLLEAWKASRDEYQACMAN
jgi:hypothetical protein